MLDLMAIAAWPGCRGLVVGRQMIKASQAISAAVQDVGDSGVTSRPQRDLARRADRAVRGL